MQWNKENDGRCEILAGDRDIFYPGDSMLFDTQDVDGFSLFEDSDPDLEGSSDSSGQMVDLHPEVGLFGSRNTDQKSLVEQGRHLSFLAQPTKRSGKKALKNIHLDDFENGAQRWAASALIGAVQRFFETVENPDSKALQEVATWIFAKNADPVSFDNCCLANEARPDVLRIRIQYELWRKGMRAVTPLPIPEEAMPEYIEQQAFFVTGMAGVTVARILWKHPGIENTTLMQMLDNRQRSALSALADQYIVSPIETAPYRWYTTAINPILRAMDMADRSGSVSYRADRRRRADMSWASLFEDM